VESSLKALNSNLTLFSLNKFCSILIIAKFAYESSASFSIPPCCTPSSISFSPSTSTPLLIPPFNLRQHRFSTSYPTQPRRMGPPANRPRTQIDMLQLIQAKSLPQASPGSPLRSSPPKSDATIKSGKKRERSVEGDTVDATSGTAKGKAKPRTGNSATGGSLPLRTAWESPWERYTEEYDLDLGGPVVVSVRKAPPVELVQVRAFPTSTAEKTLHMFRHIQHNKIVTALDAFTTDDFLYVVPEHMPVTLEQIVRCPAYADERQLRAILGQVGRRPKDLVNGTGRRCETLEFEDDVSGLTRIGSRCCQSLCHLHCRCVAPAPFAS